MPNSSASGTTRSRHTRPRAGARRTAGRGAMSSGGCSLRLPHLAALREAEAKLSPLADLPKPPEGWGDELAQLQAEAIRLTVQKEAPRPRSRALEGELERSATIRPPCQSRRASRPGANFAAVTTAPRDIPVRAGRARRQARRHRRHPAPPRPGGRGRAGRTCSCRCATVGALEDLIAERSGVRDEARRRARYARRGQGRACRGARRGAEIGRRAAPRSRS